MIEFVLLGRRAYNNWVGRMSRLVFTECLCGAFSLGELRVLMLVVRCECQESKHRVSERYEKVQALT